MQPNNQGNYWHPPGDAPVPATDIPPAAPEPSDVPGLTWQASEYVHHEKERVWFVMLFVGALVLLAVAIFLVQSISFSILIVVMTIALAVYAARQPKIVDYQLTPVSIRINNKQFYLHDFRYFGVIQDGPFSSIVLIPNKRFMPAVTLYFPVENGEAIVNVLGSSLPMEHVELDVVDKLMRHLRF